MPTIIKPLTRKVDLPSTKELPEEERAWVTIKDRLTGADWLAISLAPNTIEGTNIALACFITDWNFTEDGTAESEKLPITREWVSALPLEDYRFVNELLNEATVDDEASTLSIEQKKTSSSTSITSTTPVIEKPMVPGQAGPQS